MKLPLSALAVTLAAAALACGNGVERDKMRATQTDPHAPAPTGDATSDDGRHDTGKTPAATPPHQDDSPAGAAATTQSAAFLITAAHYVLPSGEETLLLGHYALEGDGHAPARSPRRHFRFDPSLDTPGHETTARYAPMDPPGTGCQPGRFVIPVYQEVVEAAASWRGGEDGRIVVTSAAGVEETWTVSDAGKRLYTLERAASGGADATDVYGVAMIGDTVSTPGDAPLKLADLRPHYDGTVFHRPAGGSWTRLDSAFNPAVFSLPPGYTDVYGYTTTASNIPGMLVHYSLLFNAAPASPAIFYDSGGHDFNRDRCFNDLGHNHMMWTVFRGGKEAGVIGVESTYQTTGAPILTVAGYH